MVPPQLPAMTESRPAARAIDQDSTHCLCCGRKEMSAVLKIRMLRADETQPCLMQQGSRLERLARRFLGHLVTGQMTQVLVNEFQQLAGGFQVAAFDSGQQNGSSAHVLAAYT